MKNFCSLLKERGLEQCIPQISAACIGPVTAEAAHAAGFRVDVVADEYTIRGLVHALDEWGRSILGGE